MSLESVITYPFLTPFAVWTNNPLLNMAQMFMGAAREMTATMSAPYDINAALEAAKAEERRPTQTTRDNAASAFNIASITIKGKQWAVDTVFEKISDTYMVWKFSCKANNNVRPLGLVQPNSGGHPSGMTHFVQANLPYRDVWLLGWSDPRDLHETTVFDVARQSRDTRDFFIRMSKAFPKGYDAIGISQSGIAVTEAIAQMEQEGTHLDCLPENIILAGSPMNVSVGRTPTEAWLHNLPRDVQEQMLIPIGGKPNARKFFSAKVISAASKHINTGITHPFKDQDIDGDHWLGMMHIFRENSLASRRLKYKRGLLTIAVKDDEVVNWTQTERAHEQFPHVPANRRRHHSIKEGGHFGLIQPGETLDKTVTAINAFTLG